MLQSISWQEFLIAVVLTGLLYYLAVGVLFFRKEIVLFLKGRSQSTQRTEIRDSSNQAHDDFMGKTHDAEIANPENLKFLPSNPEDIEETSSQTDEITGSVSDLMEEIKSLLAVVKDNNASRPEVRSFFESLLENYSQFIGTPYQYPISESIANTCTESLQMIFSVSEVLVWWPTQSESTNQQ